MDSRPPIDHRPLIALLAIAAAIRLPLAFWPNIIQPDEIFQYLEPAWRLLGHDSIVSWEWRYGMRGWLVPSLLAAPMAIGEWLAPGGTGAFVAPRLVAALASLSTVACAWCFGARVSRTHAIVAAFVAAIWFEFVLFAPHTLSEPLATALILPAALLVTQPSSLPRYLALGGALFAFAAVFRFQYAPAIAVLALGACWGKWRNLIPITAGGVMALIVAGVADAANGSVPFAWVFANIQQNWLHDRAATFGVLPTLTYVSSFWLMWSLALVALAPAIASGARHAPLLFATAIVNIAFHELIGHKEYRFIYLSVALLIIVAALGSANWIAWLRTNRTWRRVACPVVTGAWMLISATLAATGVMPGYWMNGVGAARLAAQIRNDPQTCGLALYKTPVPTLPGRQRLAGRSAIYAFDTDDPAAGADVAAASDKSAGAFNRMLSPRASAPEMPAGFFQAACGNIGGVETCIFTRGGGCESTSAGRFLLNDVLTRVDR